MKDEDEDDQLTGAPPEEVQADATMGDYVSTGLGVTKDLTRAASMGASLGFNIATQCQAWGFWLAHKAVAGPKAVVDTVAPGTAPAFILSAVGGAVSAAEGATALGMRVGSTVTHTALNSTHSILDHAGVEGGQLWAAAGGALVGTDAAEAMAGFATLLSEYCDELGQHMSMSEVAAALSVIKRIQRCRPRSIEPVPVPLPEPVTRYMRFAAATYGHAGLKALGMLPLMAAADDEEAAAALTGVPREHVLLFESSSSMYCPGHVLLVDQQCGCVVLAVRGTMRPQDLLTDLVCESSPLEGCPSASVHSGFQQASERLFERTQQPILDALAAHGLSQIVLCGHSLGAAVASLLALKWRACLPNPATQVQAFAYAAPCCLSLEAAKECTGVVCSVVCGDDMVPRFNLGVMTDLRTRMLTVHRMGTAHAEALCVEVEAGGVLSAEAEGLCEAVRAVRAERLYPAGDVLYMAEGAPHAHAVQSEQEQFGELVFSSSMFSTHMPGVYLERCCLPTAAL
eukprot:TRINITY_DN51063_c0_g2_i1.p1 TRINITY_DN51063_c0_g2~~TRINITY_DN51063_c0_g2_i1.p1  ORF type:complete len:513 (+),score=151.28 TRINITY_DN51063_c0_g2_i1:132-1670(+)